MKIGFEHGKLDGIKSEAVVVGVFEKFQGFKFEGGGDFKKEAAAARFTGGSGEAFFALDRIGRPQKLVLFVGLGPKESYSPAEARLAAAAAVRKLGERFVRSALFVLWAEACKGKIEDAVSAIAEGVILTSARFERYITDWTGPKGRLGRMKFKMKRPVFPGDTMVFNGRVVKTFADDAGCQWVELEVTVSVDGQVNTECQARVAIPADEHDNPWQRKANGWRP